MRKTFKAFMEKIIANLASVKVWFFIAAIVFLSVSKIDGEQFVKIMIALIAAREIWKVSKLRTFSKGGQNGDPAPNVSKGTGTHD